MLEEDIAFSALAQDDIAHAKAVYEYIAGLGAGAAGASAVPASADALAYGRTPEQYRSAQLVELNDEFDWAFAIVRQFFFDHFDTLRLQRLAHSNRADLAALASRMLTEARLALGHADGWVRRLARGTEESRTRLEKALQTLSNHACMLFEPTAGVEALEQAGIYPKLPVDMFDTWTITVTNLLEELRLPVSLQRPAADVKGGRRGVHSPDFASWLNEITEVYRVEPEAAW
jgi:ring-1,2-phenylacetyl-CoA epoxidase subunit PaaC